MNSRLRFIALALALAGTAFLGGCLTWAQTSEHRLKIDAPAKVKVDEVYTFKVDVTTADGQPAKGITYAWMIDWPEVKGMLHNGLSSEPVQMRVKGGPGKALLRIYANDPSGRRVQIDKFEFLVE